MNPKTDYPYAADRPFLLRGRWAFAVFKGPDAAAWLNGQTTQAILDLAEGAQTDAAWCDPKGRCWAYGPIARRQDSYVAAIPTPAVPMLRRALDQYLIMEDVAAEVYQGVVGVYGCGCSSFGGSWVEDRSLGLEGKLVLPLEPLPDLPQAEAGYADFLEIQAGSPKLGMDILPDTLAPELGPAFVERHISRTKGCYTGQEVISRIHHRGHTNRTWVGLVCTGSVAPGDDISVGGKVRRAAEWQGRWVATALIRNESAIPGQMVCVETQHGPVEAEVRHMPLLNLG